MKQNRSLPSQPAIRRHWSTTDLWTRKGFDSLAEFLEPGTCFACGMNHSGDCERAHIEPRVGSGSDDAANLHLLCWVCHKDSEGRTGAEYWRWFWERSTVDALMSGAARSGANLWTAMRPAGLTATGV
jgi:5-methylcytosine-specific restriction endonuclease McrA